MSSAGTESPDETFFNDLSQQVPNGNGKPHSSPKTNGSEAQKDDAANKPKRIACVLCRKRKLRCDGTRPTCGTCNRLSHDCTYDEVRKKSGPKRGYVKLLEARLQQVETLLKNQESTEPNKDTNHRDPALAYVASTLQQGLPNVSDNVPVGFAEGVSSNPDILQPNNGGDAPRSGSDFHWEMIGLGLDEPLPPQDVMNDLYEVYFSKIHLSVPVMHRPRFLAAMNLAPQMRPPVCLRYAMWALAASVTDKYDGLQEHFYQRARKYAQMDEMRGHGEATITLGHCQAWILLCTYEFKQMYFPRAWLSAGRAVRLAQMMQLHRMDGVGLDVKQCLAPPKDWTEREERRRTFWMSFCVDRYASIGTGWPVSIDERDILTNLPSSEEAFEKSKPMPTISLEQAMQANGAANIEPFAGIVLLAALFGRNLLHLHRPTVDDNDEDLNGGFWTRHRAIETILLNTALALPDKLRLPAGVQDPNIVFMNMALHTSAICLHQAAIFKADKHRLPVTVSNESKIRCVTAAAEIASVMRMVSHMDLSAMNPFISFCIYVAARVFVQYLRTRPKDQQMNSTLQFLLHSMQALRRKNPLTESFLVQLDVDLEAAGLALVDQRHPPASKSPEFARNVRDMQHISNRGPQLEGHGSCVPIMDANDARSSSAANGSFRNGDAAARNSNTPHTGNTPAPPYYVNNTQVPMEANNILDGNSIRGFVPSQTENIIHLPSRARSNDVEAFSTFVVPDDHDMDVSADDQPSPATTNSQSKAGSGSHTSYSSSKQNELRNMQYHNSPKGMSNQMPLPQTSTSNDNPTFFSTGEDIFQAGLYGAPAPMNNDPMQPGFIMSNEWDMSGMGNGMTGMMPMSEERWNQVLESVDLGWDSIGPPHGPGRI